MAPARSDFAALLTCQVNNSYRPSAVNLVPMRKSFNQIYSNQAIAVCTREQAEQLVDYDHHVVDVSGRAGVMLTYEWMPVEEHAGPFVLTIVFHHAEKHPRAPKAIQSVVDELTFKVRGQPR